jgi:monoterpene epsilon-lactone hydrolase
MASQELQAILDQFKQQQSIAAQAAGQPDVAMMRSNMESTAIPVADDVRVDSVDANGVPSEWVVAPGAHPDHRLLFLHGGGYVIGSPITHRALAGNISRVSGCAVLLIDYRMAPEDPFPAAVDDAHAALRFMRDNGPQGSASASTTFVAGDSAGGGLTLATLLAVRDAGETQPDAAVTLSAWTDLAMTGETLKTRADADPMITDPGGITFMANAYLGNAPGETPLASPLYADLSGLPPLLMQVGDAEVLLADTTRVAENAKAAGVDVTLEIDDEMFHVFQAFAQTLPEAQQAVDRIGAFIHAHVPAAAGD